MKVARSVFLGLAGALLVAGCGESKPHIPLPGEEGFKAADRLIMSKSKGVSHGNTDTARKLAKDYSEMMEIMQKIAFKGGKKDRKVSLTGEKFLVYCQETEGKIAFLVHVPQLKRYKDDVRQSLVDLSWTIAKSILEEAKAADTLEVGIGLRGSLLYGATAIGTLSQKPVTELGILSDEKQLYRFFIDPNEAANPAPTPSQPGV